MSVLDKMPDAISLEDVTSFVPRLVLTPQLQTVLQHVIRQWRHRDRFASIQKYGIRPLDRLLFFGPPGNGKTLACEWICKQLGLQLLRVHCDRMRGAYLGETTKSVANICRFLGERKEPVLCLFDEVESIFTNRQSAGADSASGHELSAATTVFMQALDRWTAPTLIVMCTNLHNQLDFALKSRVELKIEFPAPTAEQAMQCLAFWKELLCEYGAAEWGPRMEIEIASGRIPASFRAIRQSVGMATREWIARDFV